MLLMLLLMLKSSSSPSPSPCFCKCVGCYSLSWRLVFRRNILDARIKWVRDPFLDDVVQRENNLLPCLSLKHHLLSSSSSSSSSSIPIPTLLHSYPPPPLSNSIKLFLTYPSLFRICRPSLSSHPHVKLTSPFLTLHYEEQLIHHSVPHLHSTALRLLKFLMLTRASNIPLSILNDFVFDLGLPPNYLLHLVTYFPDYFRISHSHNSGFTLESVCWRKQLAVPEILNYHHHHHTDSSTSIRFPMCFPPGFDLRKKVENWVQEWQRLPYISPYEDAFHLPPATDQADKWAVAVLHEILSLLISKKTQVKNILRLGDYLGFGLRFKKALFRHPGIFYISNKIRTQTVVLREAFSKNVLLQKHPLMGMRHRYIYLMSKSRKRKKLTKLSTRYNFRTARIDKTMDVKE